MWACAASIYAGGNSGPQAVFHAIGTHRVSGVEDISQAFQL